MSIPVCPSHRVVSYALDVASGWYVKEPQRVPFGKMPDRLRVELTQDPRIRDNGANEVIHGPQVEGRWKFFTGLVPLTEPGWFEGNACDYRNGTKSQSIVLFRFSANNAALIVFYFTGFYINGREQRLRFAADFAAQMEGRARSENGNAGE